MTDKLKIMYRARRELLPYARNAMLHDDAQVAQLVDSIKEFGWTNPILIDEAGEIIAGHGRVLAAEQLGIDPVPTITLSGLSDSQKRAYRLADNRLPRNAQWDEKLLSLEIVALSELDFDIEKIGFSEAEISKLLKIEPDDIQEHWVGMPDFNQTDQNGCRQLIVHFETAIDVQNFVVLLGQKITDKTKYLWYPEQRRDLVSDKAYISDESSVSPVHNQQREG
ncbi:ParB/Srx family N-terminal domain-containing protein [Leclercia adecarboxylata]|uniref:ParB/Srx family N-terminal domain-containing protein n=1 Tax=Leclercia adecarboxylata TaxID=83655 RepID=UPI00202A307C|nr:ParB/Srx family N-terminal domain-containing protein [Leclercia adecarboxylata]URO00943.1 ParB/Srx family N-terminal domain-containing protein [Leclercia adecarboxylata]